MSNGLIDYDLDEEILSKNVASTLEAIREETDQLTSSQKDSEKIYKQNNGARDDEDEGNLNRYSDCRLSSALSTTDFLCKLEK